MSSVRHALQRLDGVVGKLEGSICDVEQAMSGQQRDMFVAPSNSNQNGAAVLAKGLDQAIEKVEKLLEEG